MTAGWDASSKQSLPGILDEISDDERRRHRRFLCRHIDMLVDILLAEQVENGRPLPAGCPSATDVNLARQRRSNGQDACSARRLSISPHSSVDDLSDCCSDPLREDGDPLDIVIATAIAPPRISPAFRYFDHEWWNAVSDLRARLGDWEEIADTDSEQLEAHLASVGIDDRASTAADYISSILDNVADMERISGLDISDLVGFPYQSIVDFLASLPGITENDSWWLLLVAFDRPVWPADHRIDSQLCSLGLIDQGTIEASSGRRTEVEELLRDREIPQLHRALSIHAVNAGVDHCENCDASKFYLTHRARRQQSDRDGGSVVDVFSGAGGLSAGFRDAGYKVEFAVDHDQEATDTFRLNHPELPHRQVVCSDITDFAPDELPERVDSDVDIVVGGPPCQALSVAGYRSRLSKDEDYSVLDDDRTALYTRYVDIIRELEPELLVMENVEGLISEVGDTGIKVADQVLEALEDEGYLCECRLLDCTRFGIPQERERVIILGGSTDVVSSREEVGSWFDRLVDSAPDESATLRHGLSGIPLIQRGEGGRVVVGGRPGRPSDYVSDNNLTTGTSLCFNHRAREHPMEKDRLLFDEAMEPGDTGWHIKYNTDYGHLVVPDVINGGDIQNRYDGATFDRDNAKADEEIEFIAIDHPLVQSITEYCLDSERAGGQTTIRTGGRGMDTPGLLCNFRIGYLSGTGETVTERLEQVFVPVEGKPTTEEIDITGSLPSTKATEYPGIERVIQQSDMLLDRAESEAWQLVEDLADDAREEREREVGIKREHAERYFESRIEELEDRIADLQSRNEESAEDLRGPIGREQQRLKDLRQERKQELERLDEDEQVVPEEPELVNVAAVIDAFEK